MTAYKPGNGLVGVLCPFLCGKQWVAATDMRHPAAENTAKYGSAAVIGPSRISGLLAVMRPAGLVISPNRKWVGFGLQVGVSDLRTAIGLATFDNGQKTSGLACSTARHAKPDPG